MIIDPNNFEGFNRVLTGLVVPRPIALVSSVSREGIVNLAPFSFFNAVSYQPAMLVVSIARSAGWKDKDTLSNIEATGEFVVNVVVEDIAEAMNSTAAENKPENLYSSESFEDFSPESFGSGVKTHSVQAKPNVEDYSIGGHTENCDILGNMEAKTPSETSMVKDDGNTSESISEEDIQIVKTKLMTKHDEDNEEFEPEVKENAIADDSKEEGNFDFNVMERS